MGSVTGNAGKGLSTQSRTLYSGAEKARYATVWATQDSRMLCLSPRSDWKSGSEEDKRKVRHHLRNLLKHECSSHGLKY